jgi:aspartyl-tRNA(Asn)/glutamyl-tRNA(Gln) amidotransferase subunit A
LASEHPGLVLGESTEPWACSAARLADAIARRALSPVEAVDAVLGRIERLDGRLNAFATVTAERARAEARQAERKVLRGEPLGRLHGVPFSVKDTLDTAGVRTTMGAARFADRVPAEDAVVVGRLRAAGAILVGKTTTPEFAHKGVTDSTLFGVTRNPWAPEHTCGGSSGGAAVAAATGMGPLAVGTDEGGSIRIPASFCGVVGLKPTFGLIPRVPVGVAELLTHLGPLCRTVEDAALFLSVTAGRDDRDGWSLPGEPTDYTRPLARPLAALRVAWSPGLGYAPVDPEVVEVTSAAVRGLPGLGWTVEEADPGFDDPAEVADAFRYPGLAAAVGDAFERERARMDPSLVALVEAGRRMTAEQVARAAVRRHALWAQLDRFFGRYDLLATPAVAVTPFPVGQSPPREIAGHPVGGRGWIAFTYPFNITGVPAIVVPAGRTAAGLPVGLQFVGRRLDDARLLGAAAAFEAAAPWADRWPAITKP